MTLVCSFISCDHVEAKKLHWKSIMTQVNFYSCDLCKHCCTIVVQNAGAKISIPTLFYLYIQVNAYQP